MIRIGGIKPEEQTMILGCERCEAEYGVTIEWHFDFKKPKEHAQLERFMKSHGHERLELEQEKEENELARRVWRENAETTTEDKMRILRAELEKMREKKKALQNN